MKPINQLTTADLVELVKGIDKKTWIKIGAGTAVAAVLLYVLILPAWVERVKIKSQVTEIQNQLNMTEHLLRKQPELLKNKENFLKENEAVKQRLYQSAEISLLLGSVSKLAQESKVSIVASNPKKADAKFPPPFDTLYQASAYDFTVEGSYHDLGSFVAKLESSAKVLRIQTFQIEPQGKAPDKHLVRISLTAVARKNV